MDVINVDNSDSDEGISDNMDGNEHVINLEDSESPSENEEPPQPVKVNKPLILDQVIDLDTESELEEEYLSEDDNDSDSDEHTYISAQRSDIPPIPGCLNEELAEGYIILMDLMSNNFSRYNWPFLEPVDPVQMDLWDYNDVVTVPMWLKKIKDNFETDKYRSVTEFAADFRLMLENCYRYNGPTHTITKKGLKLEEQFERLLRYLPSSIQEKCSIEATSGKPPEDVSHILSRRKTDTQFFSYVCHRVRGERGAREKRLKLKVKEQRAAVKEEKEREIITWEDDLLKEPLRTQLKAMWELPQISQFLYLTMGVLNVHISRYELERMFLIPQASSAMASLMTTLLVRPTERQHLSEKPPMAYTLWSQKLIDRVSQWYRVYHREYLNPLKTFELIGIEPPFWKIVGEINPFKIKSYHDLSYHQRVWIVKSLLDYLLHKHKSIQETINEQLIDMCREEMLGRDSSGYYYFHFPQLRLDDQDIRVYRRIQPKIYNEPDVVSDPPKPLLVSTHPETREYKRRKKKVKDILNKQKEKIQRGELDFSRPRREGLRQNISRACFADPLTSDEAGSSDDSSEERRRKKKKPIRKPVFFQREAENPDSGEEYSPSQTKQKQKRGRKTPVITPVKERLVKPGKRKRGRPRKRPMSKKLSRRLRKEAAEKARKKAKEEEQSTPNTDTDSREEKGTEFIAEADNVEEKDTDVTEDKVADTVEEEAADIDDKVADADTAEEEAADTKETTVEKTEEKAADNDTGEDRAMDTDDSRSRIDSETESPRKIFQDEPQCKYEVEDDSQYAEDIKTEIKEEIQSCEPKPDVSVDQVKEEEFKSEKEEEVGEYEPNIKEFEMIVDSIESLRELIDNLKSSTDNDTKSSKSGNTKEKLIENLENLLTTFEPWSQRIQKIVKPLRAKMKKEWEDYLKMSECQQESEEDEGWGNPEPEPETNSLPPPPGSPSSPEPQTNDTTENGIRRRLRKRKAKKKRKILDYDDEIDSTNSSENVHVSSRGRVRKVKKFVDHVSDEDWEDNKNSKKEEEKNAQPSVQLTEDLQVIRERIENNLKNADSTKDDATVSAQKSLHWEAYRQELIRNNKKDTEPDSSSQSPRKLILKGNSVINFGNGKQLLTSPGVQTPTVISSQHVRTCQATPVVTQSLVFGIPNQVKQQQVIHVSQHQNPQLVQAAAQQSTQQMIRAQQVHSTPQTITLPQQTLTLPQHALTLQGAQQPITLHGAQQTLTLQGTQQPLTLQGTQQPLTLQGTQQTITLQGTQQSLALQGSQQQAPQYSIASATTYVDKQSALPQNVVMASQSSQKPTPFQQTLFVPQSQQPVSFNSVFGQGAAINIPQVKQVMPQNQSFSNIQSRQEIGKKAPLIKSEVDDEVIFECEVKSPPTPVKPPPVQKVMVVGGIAQGTVQQMQPTLQRQFLSSPSTAVRPTQHYTAPVTTRVQQPRPPQKSPVTPQVQSVRPMQQEVAKQQKQITVKVPATLEGTPQIVSMNITIPVTSDDVGDTLSPATKQHLEKVVLQVIRNLSPSLQIHSTPGQVQSIQTQLAQQLSPSKLTPVASQQPTKSSAPQRNVSSIQQVSGQPILLQQQNLVASPSKPIHQTSQQPIIVQDKSQQMVFQQRASQPMPQFILQQQPAAKMSPLKQIALPNAQQVVIQQPSQQLVMHANNAESSSELLLQQPSSSSTPQQYVVQQPSVKPTSNASIKQLLSPMSQVVMPNNTSQQTLVIPANSSTVLRQVQSSGYVIQQSPNIRQQLIVQQTSPVKPSQNVMVRPVQQQQQQFRAVSPINRLNLRTTTSQLMKANKSIATVTPFTPPRFGASTQKQRRSAHTVTVSATPSTIPAISTSAPKDALTQAVEEALKDLPLEEAGGQRIVLYPHKDEMGNTVLRKYVGAQAEQLLKAESQKMTAVPVEGFISPRKSTPGPSIPVTNRHNEVVVMRGQGNDSLQDIMILDDHVKYT